jgi:hypothetical protein
LYAVATACVILIQWLVVFPFHVPFGYQYSTVVLLPLLTTLVYAFSWADSDESPQPATSTWERVLERSWAVIVLDLAVGLIQGTGIASIAAADPIDVSIGIVVLVVSAPLVFADTSATVDEMPVWWLLPGALWRGVRAARGAVYVRAIALVALGLLVQLVQKPLFDWMQSAHVANAEFWSQVPLNAITVAPIGALTALIYRDATREAADDAADSGIGD